MFDDDQSPEALIRELSGRRWEDAELMQQAIEIIVTYRVEFDRQQAVIRAQNGIIVDLCRRLGIEAPFQYYRAEG